MVPVIDLPVVSQPPVTDRGGHARYLREILGWVRWVESSATRALMGFCRVDQNRPLLPR